MEWNINRPYEMTMAIDAQNPKITVIMPTFNRAGLISKSIESVLNQTFKDFEFLYFG